MKVLFSYVLSPDVESYFTERLGEEVELTFLKTKDSEVLRNLIRDTDILIGSDKVTPELLQRAEKLKLVLFAYAGIDHLLVHFKPYPDLIVANSRGNTVPTAQHALALLLTVSNWTARFDRKMRNGMWRQFDEETASALLHERTAGILGMGSIGRQITRLLRGLTFDTIGCSRTGNPIPEFSSMKIYESCRLDDFLKQSQILIVCLPRTVATDGMIGERELNLLPEGAILIQIARGSIIQEAALFNALRSGRLMGAGIDVWYNYRPTEIDGKRYPYSFPFHELDNVVLSPHRASSPYNRPDRYDDVIDNIRRFIRNEPVLNKVDMQLGY